MAPRNLFRVRTAEYIKDDAVFLQLFGPAALDIFEPGEIWSRMQIIRSSRGGGKTSVLRIFSPQTLNAVRNRTSDLKPLVDKLVELGVLSNAHDINVLGVYLSLVGSYPILENIGLEPSRQQRLFFALLASKIIISTLRSVCNLKNARFPDDLHRVRVGRPDDSIRECVPVPCDGARLYEWARGMEKRVYAIMDGKRGSDRNMGGFETMSIVRLIQHSNLSYDGGSVVAKTLLMLDDMDKITRTQQKALAHALADLRVPSVWMAERLEALKPEQLLSVNGTEGREWGEPLILERFWRDKSRYRKFASLLEVIANQRADPQSQHSNFRAMFTDVNRSDPRFAEAARRESERLYSKYGRNDTYRQWLDRHQNPDCDPAEQAMNWRLLEINIERSERDKQQRLSNAPLGEAVLQRSSDVKHVADFHMRQNHQIPYYHGFDNLAILASSNILQFLSLAGDFFDERLNARTVGQPDEILPERQEEILERAAGRYWDDVCRIVQNPALEDFIGAVVRFCKRETGRPNAPYCSVTGIAISNRDLKYLQNLTPHDARPEHALIADILSQCFAHNILGPRPDSLQGPAGTRHLVMYLNRLLCVQHKLPLAYGGWRQRSLADLESFSRNIVMARKTAGIKRRNGSGHVARTTAARADPAQRGLEIGRA